MTRNLKIILINVNSLITHSKRAIFENFLNSNCPDIALVTETKLNPNLKPKFKNYNLIRTDRISENPGGGVCILINENIKFDVLNLPAFNSLEVSGVKIYLKDNQFINIYSCYHSSFIKLSIDPSDIQAIVQHSGNTPFVIGGYFNSKHIFWNNSHNCPNGIKLYNWFSNNNINFDMELISPQEKTRKNSVLDFFFVSTSLLNSLTPPTVIAGISDHESVVLFIKTFPH